jgi:trehalose-phosphatase
VSLRGTGTFGLLLDYDGTLTDIAATPDLARMDAGTRTSLNALAAIPGMRLAIITGRSREGLAEVTGPLHNVTLAVNGGLRIIEPGSEWTEPHAAALRPVLGTVARDLAAAVARWPGVLLEDKELSLTVHYRQCPAARPELEHLLAEIQHRVGPDVRLLPGKQSVEIQPAVEWDKGRAALALLDRWGIRDTALFLGDDRIDEPAFLAVRQRGGVTCRIADEHLQTAAEWLLPEPEDARQLLGLLVDRLRVSGR